MKTEEKQCQIEIVPKTIDTHQCFTLFTIQCCSNVPKPEYEVLSHMLSCPYFFGSHDTAIYKFLCCFFIFFKALASHFQPLNSMFRHYFL